MCTGLFLDAVVVALMIWNTGYRFPLQITADHWGLYKEDKTYTLIQTCTAEDDCLFITDLAIWLPVDTVGRLNLLLKKALRLDRMVSLPQNRRIPCVYDLLQIILIEANTAISYTAHGQEWRCFLHVEIFIDQKIIFDTGRYRFL